MKKNIFLLLIAVFVLQITHAQSVAINTDGSAPNSSAQLDIKSSSKGLLIPRMTSANRTAIVNPAQGLIVFDTNTNSFWFYNGTAWGLMDTGQLWAAGYSSSIYNTNTGNISIGPVFISPFAINNRVTIGFPDDPTNPGLSGNDLAIYNPDGLEGMSLYQSTSASYFYSNTNMALMPFNNLGIGTATPSTKLEVLTANASWGIIHTNGGVRVGTYVGSNGGWVATQSNSPLYFATSLLNTNGSAQMSLLQNGNLGVGGTNPADKFEVTTADASYGIIHTNGVVKVGTYVGSNGGWLGTKTNHPLYLFSNNSNAIMTIATNGNVGIGTINPAYKLSVSGTIQTKEVRVETGWADFVFDKGYQLKPLPEVEEFIHANKHLENIPSAKEIQDDGLAVGEMQTKMMQKIEELTLYVIELQKQINELKKNMK